MTAWTSAHVECNFVDTSKPPGEQLCYARITEGRTKAQARAVAREEGWLVNVYGDGRKPPRPSLGWADYCPDHIPTGGSS